MEWIVTIITGIATITGTALTVWKGNSITQYRLEQLEKKQDKHNTLIERMYKLEDSINIIEEKQKVVNHRIDSLEGK